MKIEDLNLVEIDALDLTEIQGGIILGPQYYAMDMMGSFALGMVMYFF